jgi:Ice-binding-like
MKGSTHRYGTNLRSRKFLLLFVFGVLLALGSAGKAFAFVSPPAVGLGTADSFAVLAHTGVTDTLVPCCSTINGNLGNDGNNPTTGTPTINGTSYVNDAGGVAAGARAALNAAIIDASGRTPNLTFGAGDNQLGVAAVLTPGVYSLPHAPTANLVGNLTLSGSATDVWIFQATSDLVTTVGSSTQSTDTTEPTSSPHSPDRPAFPADARRGVAAEVEYRT